MIKRDKFKRLLAVVFWLIATALGLGLVATGSHAGTYYIGPNGDYATFAAWKAAVPTPATGSDVYFECGGTFYPTQKWYINWAGTDPDRATIGAFYISGASRIIGVSGEKPILSGNNYSVPPGLCDYTHAVGGGLIEFASPGHDYVTIQNIHITQSRGGGISINGQLYAPTYETKYFIIEDCIIDYNYSFGISVARNKENYGIIRRNYLAKNAMQGNWNRNWQEESSGTGDGYFTPIKAGDSLNWNHPVILMPQSNPNSNMVIEDNVLVDNYGESIGIGNTSDNINTLHSGYMVVRRNVDVGMGMMYIDGNEYITLEDNIIIRGNLPNRYTYGGVVFSWYGLSINNESYPEGAADPAYNAGQNNHIIIRNNLIASSITGISLGFEEDYDYMTDVEIYNNTFIANYYGVRSITPIASGRYTNCSFKNNVVFNPAGTVYSTDQENMLRYMPGWTFANNAGRGGTSAYGTGYVTIGSEDFATTMNDEWQKLDTIEKMLAVSADEFKISNVSKLIDAGATIAAVTEDFFGTVRPAGSAYDIGAHEYNDFPNLAPVISQVTPGNITIYPDDLTQTFSCTATDLDGDDVTVAWDFTTSGAYASNFAVAAPGELALIDPETYPASYTITITATDEFGLSTNSSFVIQIIADAEASSCQEWYAPSLTADFTAPAIGAYNGQEFVGPIFQPASNISLCAVDFYIRGKTGTPSGTLYLRVFTLDESNRPLTVVGTSIGISASSAAAGSWLSSNAGVFSFDTALTLTSGTKYGFGIFRDTDSNLTDDPETDNANYLSLGTSNDTNTDNVLWGRYAWSYGTGTFPYAVPDSDAADDILIKVHTMQAQSESIIVNRVYAVTPNGTYKEGDSIQLAIEFNLPVALTDANSNSTKNFTGTATVGGQTFTATHSFPAFATEATTHYLTGTVPASSSGLLETITLNLNGDAMGTADLTIGAGKNVGSNSEIYFDTSAPAIASFYACDEDGVQITDTTLISTVTSGYVCMESDGDSIFFADGPLGNLTLSLANIVPAVTARYLSGIGTSKLIFQWYSVAGNRGTDAAVAGTDAFDPTPTVLMDQAGNALTLTLPNTWLIDANELNFAVPKSLIYGAGWWVASDWDTEKPDPVVEGDYFVLGAGALDATETISESGITLNVIGNTTSTVTISGDNNEIWYRQGSALTITDNGTGNVVVKNCPECE